MASGDERIVLSTQVANDGQCARHVRVVRVVETCTNRSALLLSTDIDVAAARLYGYDKARFQIACLCRDAKHLTGLSDCQARSQAKLAFPVNMSLMAVTCATLAGRQDAHDQLTAFSLASLKRRDVPQPLMARLLTT